MEITSIKHALDETLMKTITTYNFRGEDINRFWSKMIKRSNGCWEWTGRTHGRGYGKFTYFSGGKSYSISAHRVSYFLRYGSIPPKLHVLHTCDTLICINPEHLFLGTNGDNRRDSVAKGRAAKANHIITDEEVKEMRSLWKSGLANQRELARRFGISDSTVGTIVNYQTRLKPWTPKRLRALIPRNNKYIRKYRILHPDQVLEIRRRYIPYDKINGGRPLSIEFGVAYSYLKKIVQRRIWKKL